MSPVAAGALAALGLWLVNRCRVRLVRTLLNIYLVFVSSATEHYYFREA